MSENQQFPTMLGPKPKPFNCVVCHQEHTHGSWEDTEVFFSDKMSTHLGCLQSHYKELLSHARLAYENATSLLQLIEHVSQNNEKGLEDIALAKAFTHILSAGVPILRDIITNLKGALHE